MKESKVNVSEKQWEEWGYAHSMHGGYIPPSEAESLKAWHRGIERARQEAIETAKSDADYVHAIAKDAGVVDLTHLPTDHSDHPYQNGHTDETCEPQGVDATLAERGTRYGEFKDQAVYADGINKIMVSSPNWETMAPDQREALRIVANKIGRILNGDPDYADSWHDIAGYATLVDKRLSQD